MFFTVRIGALCIERPEAASIRLERSVVPDSEAVVALGQRYTIECVEGSEVETASKWNDLGELVVPPNETAPDASTLFYTPHTRLCLQRSFLLWPKENEKVGLLALLSEHRFWALFVISHCCAITRTEESLRELIF